MSVKALALSPPEQAFQTIGWREGTNEPLVGRFAAFREAARRVGRDVKAVHTDATALLKAGVLDRTEEGKIEFPYEAVRVEFLLQAA